MQLRQVLLVYGQLPPASTVHGDIETRLENRL